MTADIEARIASARTAHEMHTIADEAARSAIAPSARTRLQWAFAARCIELWPKQCAKPKRGNPS